MQLRRADAPSRGIADLVSEAVKLEAEGEDSKVRGTAGYTRLVYGLTRVPQDARDAQKMLGHIDRKLVKQVRAAASGAARVLLMRLVRTSADGHDLCVRRHVHGRTRPDF